MNRRTFVPADLAVRAAMLSLFSNLGLMVMKLAAGVISGSVAVLSDGIDSAQDVLASAIALFSLRVGARPPDLEHPYGHGRAETIAATLQGLLITAGAVYICLRGVMRLLDPPDSIGTGVGLASMAFTAAVNFGVMLYVRRAARLTGSPAITADALHLITNIVQAAAILLALALVALTGVVALDGAIALLLALYLFWTAARILWTAAGDVLDMSLGDEEVRFVEAAILEEGERIEGFHRLRTRKAGRHRYVDLHLVLRPDLTVEEAHAITERIEARVRERWPATTVTIHTEPADGRFLGPRAPLGGSRGREGER